MPDVVIGGDTLPNVHAVTVNITHPAGEAGRLPDCSATITIPTDHKQTLFDWALAKQGPDRFKKVKITTYDRSKKPNKTWTFAKAYLSNIHEGEFIGNGPRMTTFTIVGTLIHAAKDYDGTNILLVEGADAEVAP